MPQPPQLVAYSVHNSPVAQNHHLTQQDHALLKRKADQMHHSATEVTAVVVAESSDKDDKEKNTNPRAGSIGWTPTDVQSLETAYSQHTYITREQAGSIAASLECGATTDQVNKWFTKKRRKNGDATTDYKRVGWTVSDKLVLNETYQSDAYITKADAEALAARLECRPTTEQVKKWFDHKRQRCGDAARDKEARYKAWWKVFTNNTDNKRGVGWTPNDMKMLEAAYESSGAYTTKPEAKKLAESLECGATAEQVKLWFDHKRNRSGHISTKAAKAEASKEASSSETK